LELKFNFQKKLGINSIPSATFFDNIEGSPFQTTQIFNEIRYYPKLKEGKNKRSFFIGPHVGYGMFTLRIPKFITSIVDTELKEEGKLSIWKKCLLWDNDWKENPHKKHKI
jgi:hypothetical protein